MCGVNPQPKRNKTVLTKNRISLSLTHTHSFYLASLNIENRKKSAREENNTKQELQLKLRMEDSVSSSNTSATNVAQAIHTALDWASSPDARQNAVAFLDSVLSSSFHFPRFVGQ